jgi:hypothetical protein
MKTAVVAAIAAALALAGTAQAEMPQNRGAPELTGRAAVGWGVVGHNGSWLYDNGLSCGPECTFAFAWERCRAAGCVPIAGAQGRVYKVRVVDVGSRLRVIVSATKHDCGAGNQSAGTQECRWVTRSAASAQTDVVARPMPKPKAQAKPKTKSKKARPI